MAAGPRLASRLAHSNTAGSLARLRESGRECFPAGSGVFLMVAAKPSRHTYGAGEMDYPSCNSPPRFRYIKVSNEKT